MAYWYYAGRTTTPIDLPDLGPVVIRPRSRFHAPQSAVSHLLKTTPPLVKRLPDPPPAEKAEAVAPPASKPAKGDEAKESTGVGSASSETDVLASGTDSAAADAEADGVAEEGAVSVPEKSESKRSRRTRRSQTEG